MTSVPLLEAKRLLDSSSELMAYSETELQVQFFDILWVEAFIHTIHSFSVCRNPACLGRQMTWDECHPNRPSPYAWRCPNSNCRRKIYERVGSLFEDGNLPLSKYLSLIHYWSFNISIKATAALTQLPENTVVYWHKVRLEAIHTKRLIIFLAYFALFCRSDIYTQFTS